MSTDPPVTQSDVAHRGAEHSDPTNVRGRRIGAVFIDIAVLLIPSIVIAFAFLEKQSGLTSCDQVTANLKACFSTGDNLYLATGGRLLGWQLVNVLLGLAYFVVLQGRTGWTVGKLAVGIRVVDASGSSCGVARACVRYLPFLVPAVIPILGSILGFVIAIVEFVLILAHNRHQRMGDIFARTFVIRQDAVGHPVS